MPIYAYRCSGCGHAKDVLQKISDPLLTTCPACGAESFQKQLTAAGFQLKGSGWYATDFRGGSAPATSAPATGAAAPAASESPAAAAPAAAPATPCGGSCACH
jgi:putative FmdB family regulatory protein